MTARLKYGQLAPEGLEKLRALGHILNTETGLEPVLLELVRLRIDELSKLERDLSERQQRVEVLRRQLS